MKSTENKVLLLVFPSLLLIAPVEIATETWLNQVKVCTFMSPFLIFFFKRGK